jgi:hypothetical protein
MMGGDGSTNLGMTTKDYTRVCELVDRLERLQQSSGDEEIELTNLLRRYDYTWSWSKAKRGSQRIIIEPLVL